MNKCQCGNTKLENYSKMYYKCPDCRTLVSKHDFNKEIYSVENEEEDLYGSNYWQEVMTREANVDSLDELIDLYIPERASYWADKLLKYIDLNGNIAEVGCGMGQLSYLLKLSGFDVVDFELSPDICKCIEKKLGLSVINGELSENYGKFSTIIAIDVFEHLTEPRLFLETCSKSIKEDGVLVLQTPCYDPKLTYEQMQKEKPKFEHLLVEEQHVYLYSRESISALLKEYGFDTVCFEPAFFGDDYDMFLFASKKEVLANKDEDIDAKLYDNETGRLVKGLITLRRQYKELVCEDEAIKKEREKILDDLQILTGMVHDLEKSNETMTTAANERLEMIDRLNVENKKVTGLLEDEIEKNHLLEIANTINIGINLSTLYPGKIGGAEQYVRNVIKEMGKMDYVNVYLFVNEVAFDTFDPLENRFVIKIETQKNVDSQLLINIDYYKIDVMFCPLFFVAPDKCPVPVVASILDIQHEFYPQYFDKAVLKEIRERTDKTLKTADAIITISEYSKKTIVDRFGVSPSKIKVTYLDADSMFEREIDEKRKQSLTKEFGEDFIFYPANSWPHKNHLSLLKAFKILKEKYGIRNKLVFSGDSKQKTAEIHDYINKNDLQDDVIYLGYREQEDMPCIYSIASILVFPSLFEGFGIPLVEAMKTKTPIACSSCGSIPEVAQNAALYFDAENPADIADKINTLLGDEALRQNLITNGIEVSKQYSWVSCTSKTVCLLRKIAGKIDVMAPMERVPLVTIITPSYNQGDFIQETIESVLNQDYPNLEYIVMDGGSTDSTIDILRRYGDRIKWFSEKDEGQGDAVNKGIKLAKGEIIGWLNSDDTYLDGTVSRAVDYLVNHQKSVMVYGEAYYTNKDGEITERYPTMAFDRDILASNCFICQPSGFFRKDAAIDAGLIDKSYQCSMDYEFWMRLSEVGNISFLPEYMATSRLYEDNKTLSQRDVVFRECFKAVKAHYGFVPISWCKGYADYKASGKRNLKYYCVLLHYFLKNNSSNRKYVFDSIVIDGSGKVKNALRRCLKNNSDSFVQRYEDGWVGKKCVFTVEITNPSEAIVISGKKNWSLHGPLIISVYLDGNIIEKIRIKENGDFSKRINTANVSLGKHEIMLVSNKSFCPAKISDSQDERELSFVLYDLSMEEK